MSNFHGLPCWYELSSADPAGAKGFYTGLLGWTWSEVPMGPEMTYHIAARGAAQVAGMMAAMEGQPLGWTCYFAVDDADALAAQAAGLGAMVMVPPTDIPGTGRFAILCDPWGAAFGVLQPLPGDVGAAFNQKLEGHGNWHELISPDPAAALEFYGALFGWAETRAVPMAPEMTYHVFAREGLDIGGTFALPDRAAHWKPYFGTGSTQAAVGTVAKAGGRVLHGPYPVPGGAFTLQIEDAQGQCLALVGPA